MKHWKVLMLAVLLGSTSHVLAEDASGEKEAKADAALGKELAFNRKKGNCLACHQIEGGDLPGNSGPPLLAMKARYPEKAKLRAQIWDATVANPYTLMPPFGRHAILSEQEIDHIVEFIYSL